MTTRCPETERKLTEIQSDSNKKDNSNLLESFFELLNSKKKNSHSAETVSEKEEFERQCNAEADTIWKREFQAESKRLLELNTPLDQPATEFAKRLISGAKSADDYYNANGPGVSASDCAGALQLALWWAGLPQFMRAGDAWQMQTAIKKSGRFIEVPYSKVRPGDIFFRQPNPAVKDSVFGHCGTITGRDKDGLIETSDFVQRFDQNSPRYKRDVFYRFVR